MEDRRITRTKRSLKAAMTEMLAREDFEHISITELCRRADISRITFYSHYNDKYALLDDIFEDMLQIGTEDYYRRQREYNPAGKLAAGYVNMLDAILELYYNRFDFFQHTNPEKNPYLLNIPRKKLRDSYVLVCLGLSMSLMRKIHRWRLYGRRRECC